jgi:hypothetical protein
MDYQAMFRTAAMTVILGLAGSTALAGDCGEPPAEPAIVDGSEATMDEMVANSEEVKGYIKEADAYLDCREGQVKTEAFKEKSDEDKVKWMQKNKKVLDERNGIGDKFNDQVAEYKKANPQPEQ